MTEIQLTDEEILMIDVGLIYLTRGTGHRFTQKQISDLKSKLITAQNQQKVVEPIEMDDNIRTIHPTEEEFNEYMDRYDNRSNP